MVSAIMQQEVVVLFESVLLDEIMLFNDQLIGYRPLAFKFLMPQNIVCWQKPMGSKINPFNQFYQFGFIVMFMWITQ